MIIRAHKLKETGFVVAGLSSRFGNKSFVIVKTQRPRPLTKLAAMTINHKLIQKAYPQEHISTNFYRNSTNLHYKSTKLRRNSTDFYQNSTKLCQNSTNLYCNSANLRCNSTDFYCNSTNFCQNSTNLRCNSTDFFACATARMIQASPQMTAACARTTVVHEIMIAGCAGVEAGYALTKMPIPLNDKRIAACLSGREVTSKTC
jgi:hypothetical protein